MASTVEILQVSKDRKEFAARVFDGTLQSALEDIKERFSRDHPEEVELEGGSPGRYKGNKDTGFRYKDTWGIS